MLFSPIKPMLLQTGKEVFDDDMWQWSIKFDGWRVLIHKQGDRIEAYTRHGNIITSKFPELQEVGRSITVPEAIIDCEGVVFRNGVSVFDHFNLRGRLTDKEKIRKATQTHPASFVAFDVLQTNSSHIKEPLIERKKRLDSIIKPSNSLLITPSIIGDGTHIYQLTKEKNMEGIVGKRIDSTYQINHRSSDWLKIKHFKTTNATILGFKEQPFSLVVGTQMQNGHYRPLATVEFGFKPHEKMAFRNIAKQLIKKQEKGITWIEPLLECTVQYLEKTEKGMLRIVSFKGFNVENNSSKLVTI